MSGKGVLLIELHDFYLAGEFRRLVRCMNEARTILRKVYQFIFGFFSNIWGSSGGWKGVGEKLNIEFDRAHSILSWSFKKSFGPLYERISTANN